MPKLLPASLALVLTLAACSSFGPSTPPAPRTLDPLQDDVAGLLIAFDLPRGIGPMPNASTLTFAVSNARRVTARLVPSDADKLASRLPPPSDGHAYYFFALPEADQAAIRSAQAASRRAGLQSTDVAVVVSPGLCSAHAYVDPWSMKVSVLAAAASGGRFLPLIDREKLFDFLDKGSTSGLPPCP